jgi:c-di-GMP-binding flagellar brake protein YcgR
MSPGGDGVENRRFERFNVDCRVKLIRNLIGNKSVHYGRASNISIGGIMLVAPVDLEAGESITLEFNIPPKTEVLAVRGIVRRRFGTYTYGIEFRDMSPRAEQSMTRMCETLRVLDSVR